MIAIKMDNMPDLHMWIQHVNADFLAKVFVLREEADRYANRT